MAPGSYAVTVRTASPRSEPTHGEGRGERNAEDQGALVLWLGPEASGSLSQKTKQTPTSAQLAHDLGAICHFTGEGTEARGS